MRNRRKIIWYHPDLKEFARDLRNNATESEQILWQKLKGKQIQGFDFHRQKPLLYYIVDFYCHELNLAIEVDGSAHDSPERKLRDDIRQDELQDYGIKFLRFRDEDIINNLSWVYKANRELDRGGIID